MVEEEAESVSVVFVLFCRRDCRLVVSHTTGAIGGVSDCVIEYIICCLHGETERRLFESVYRR